MKCLELTEFNTNTLDIIQDFKVKKEIKKSYENVPEMVTPESFHFDQVEAVQMGKHEAEGFILTLKGCGIEDLKRMVLKSDTCSLNIPEIELESPEGTPKFASIHSIIDEIYGNLKKHYGGYVSNINSKTLKETQKNPIFEILSDIEAILDGTGDFTLILSDPLGLSRIELKDDKKVFCEKFKRTDEMNEEYGITE
jgi:zinc finger protein